MKTFFIGKNVPLIPPLNVGNKFVADFKETARLFNHFFASKCAPVTNDSSLPRSDVLNSTSSIMMTYLKSLDLSINKAHGHDNISIRMIKICHKVIVKPLSIIYKNCIDTGILPDIPRFLS